MFTCLLVMVSIALTRAQTSPDYGKTRAQVEILNLDCLHEKGFTGKGVTIAHLDDGFDNIETLEAFQYARDKKLFKGEYDFSTDNTDIAADEVGSHGLQTTSIVNGYLPGEYIGTGFDANILLARTEYTPTETHKEEKNWAKAVHWAIENDADIITSSLQYNEFDEGEGNYTYDDMDGNTTIITKAADYAASRGILVVAIQGNFGNDEWHYLGAPGDADSVLTVGAVSDDGKKAGFSSYGPASDGRVKPDVMAVGARTMMVNPDGSITPGNGTSYAGPAIAGLAACLMQAHPKRTNMEIIAAIRQSADRYLSPSVHKGFGYGIPDACKAHDILTEMDNSFAKQEQLANRPQYKMRLENKQLELKPRISKRQIKKIFIFNTINEKMGEFSRKNLLLNLNAYPAGHYILHVQLKDGKTLVDNFLLK